MLRLIIQVTLLVYLFATCGGTVASKELPPEKPLVLVHYMPWYASKSVSGQWGWHWTMNHFDPEKETADQKRPIASHHYPLIGPYDSSDPDLLQCHVQWMKLAGIDGVIIDWYGIKAFRDYGQIHQNTKALIQVLKTAGLQFAICYEDQSIKHMVDDGILPKENDVAHGTEVLRWMHKHWFSDPLYVRLDDRPVLLVFGPQHFSKAQWNGILGRASGGKQSPALFGLPHLKTERAFGWPPVHGGRQIEPTQWREYLQLLYSREDRRSSVISIAFPGFHDIYEQAALHRSYGRIEHRDGRTLDETFSLAMRSDSRIIQIATWNDYGEGTVVEPTREFGYRYLEKLQMLLRPGGAGLTLPARLYNLRKRFSGDPQQLKTLSAAADLLLDLQCEQARTVINAVQRD